jgi:hypothetical protein
VTLRSSLDDFSAWRMYRTWGVPGLLLAALLSILFRGAFLALPPGSESPLGPDQLRPALAAGFFGASLLMLMHASYLLLMAYHLVYRFPVERIQLIGLALFPISLAYVLYACYDYTRVSAVAGVSTGAFALAYLVLAAHGGHEAFTEHRHARATPGDGSRNVPVHELTAASGAVRRYRHTGMFRASIRPTIRMPPMSTSSTRLRCEARPPPGKSSAPT